MFLEGTNSSMEMIGLEPLKTQNLSLKTYYAIN